MGRHAQGVLMIHPLIGDLPLARPDFFTRLIHLDAWAMLFWRGVCSLA